MREDVHCTECGFHFCDHGISGRTDLVGEIADSACGLMHPEDPTPLAVAKAVPRIRASARSHVSGRLEVRVRLNGMVYQIADQKIRRSRPTRVTW